MDIFTYLPVLIVVAAGLLLFIRRNSAPSIPLVAQPLMTAHELALVGKLAEVAASRDLHVVPQVSMGAFLTVKRGTDKALRATLLNKILKKRSDFVLVDEDSNVRLIVELDDRTHQAERDAARDELPAAAGIQTVRLRNARSLTLRDIERAIAPALS